MFGIFMQLQLKRMARHLPLLLAGAMLLVVLTGSIAFLSSKKLYEDAVTGTIRLGVVYQGKAQADHLFIQTLSDQDTLEGMTEFKEMNEADARQALSTGDLTGVIILPEDFIRKVVEGVNEPATILLNKNRPLESQLLQVLTSAGAKTLSASQGALYASYDIFRAEKATPEQLTAMNLKVNEEFLGYALGRDEVFRSQVLQATGEISPLHYFLSSWLTLFFLLMGMLEAFVLKPFAQGLLSKLEIEGIGPIHRQGVDWLRLFLLQLLFFALIFALWAVLGPKFKVEMNFLGLHLLSALALSFAFSAFILMIYTLTGDLLTGMLTLFGLSFLAIFLSGGFIPTSFLPGAVRQLQNFIPTTWWIKSMAGLVTGEFAKFETLLTLLSAVCFFAVSALAEVRLGSRRLA